MSISDRLDETTEQSARVIGSVMSRWDMDGRPDVDGGIDTLIARALAEAGLLAPAPLAEVQADAWDEGWEACHAFMGRGIFPPRTNPYRNGAGQ